MLFVVSPFPCIVFSDTVLKQKIVLCEETLPMLSIEVVFDLRSVRHIGCKYQDYE